jgi:hypothetical protein
MIETLLGGLFGGILRLAPEVIKLLDRKDERKHELSMLDSELELAKTRSETDIRKASLDVDLAQLTVLGEAFKEQSATAQIAGRAVAAFSALVRPITTYIFIGLYACVKLAAYILAIQQGGAWQAVLVSMWASEDMAVLNMVLSFWFVGRVYERTAK